MVLEHKIVLQHMVELKEDSRRVYFLTALTSWAWWWRSTTTRLAAASTEEDGLSTSEGNNNKQTLTDHLVAL